MGHIILLGDSIFDNARYVPDRPPVIEQVRHGLPADWKATLLAIDGHVTSDVADQLTRMPDDATHLVLSVGGNDALGEHMILHEPARTVGNALDLVHEVQARFRAEYRRMLQVVGTKALPITLCTVYDSIPDLGNAEKLALGAFNEVILRAAFQARLPVIDLRLVCSHKDDYSPLSPIEPSFLGGAKIARLIVEVATGHDFSRAQSVVYW